MISTHSYEFLRWPSLREWQAILRGLSASIRADTSHTLLCHLARIATKRYRVDYAVARDFVDERIAEHAYTLGIELGLGDGHARQVAHQLAQVLDQLRHVNTRERYSPTREEWLAIDRAAAQLIGLDGSHTLSSNLACIVATRVGWSLATAKLRVHASIARHARQLAGEIGFGWFESVFLQVRLNAWLDSFDRP